PFGQFVRTQTCPQCRGAGDMPSEACPACDGRGRVPTTLAETVDIPAGIAHGQRIRMSGRGGAGERGAGPGDLYVQVSVAEDARFARDGLDIVTRVAVPVTDAMVGTTIAVPTVDGEAEVELRPGTQSGDELVMRGRGFPALAGRGRRGWWPGAAAGPSGASPRPSTSAATARTRGSSTGSSTPSAEAGGRLVRLTVAVDPADAGRAVAEASAA